MQRIASLEPIPSPDGKRISVHVGSAAQRQIRCGHPWLFDKSITSQSHNGRPGDLAIIYDRKNKFLAAGIYDPFSPIRVRILQHRKSAEINKEWFSKKLQEAAKIRENIPATDTNGYRLVHGEGDGMPGLVADRYADTLVIKIYSPAWIPHLADVATALLELLPFERVVLRMNRLTLEQPDCLYGLENHPIIYGPPLEGGVVFRENGIIFEADPVKGQKTGFFLDQRENRARAEKLSGGKDVLNVFSYTGGFSLYAARGGAKSVTNIDISKKAMDASTRNFKLNSCDKRIAACPHKQVVDDAFKSMERLKNEAVNYDMVIIDPPSFAKKQGEADGALNAYSRLTKLGLGVLRRGGTLIIASCSSRVGADEFFRTVLESAKSVNRSLDEIERTRHPIDHPDSFPEGAYLKCLFAKA